MRTARETKYAPLLLLLQINILPHVCMYTSSWLGVHSRVAARNAGGSCVQPLIEVVSAQGVTRSSLLRPVPNYSKE